MALAKDTSAQRRLYAFIREVLAETGPATTSRDIAAKVIATLPEDLKTEAIEAAMRTAVTRVVMMDRIKIFERAEAMTPEEIEARRRDDEDLQRWMDRRERDMELGELTRKLMGRVTVLGEIKTLGSCTVEDLQELKRQAFQQGESMLNRAAFYGALRNALERAGVSTVAELAPRVGDLVYESKAGEPINVTATT